MKEKIIIVLRWVSVPIAAIFGSIVAHLLGMLYALINGIGIEYYTGETSSIGMATIILFLIKDFYVGYAFVWCGSYVAPSSKKNVSIVLATVQGCICVIGALLMIMGYSNSSLRTWAAVIITLIGGIIASVRYKVNVDL